MVAPVMITEFGKDSDCGATPHIFVSELFLKVPNHFLLFSMIYYQLPLIRYILLQKKF